MRLRSKVEVIRSIGHGIGPATGVESYLLVCAQVCSLYRRFCKLVVLAGLSIVLCVGEASVNVVCGSGCSDVVAAD